MACDCCTGGRESKIQKPHTHSSLTVPHELVSVHLVQSKRSSNMSGVKIGADSGNSFFKIISALNMSGVKTGADSGRSHSGETTNRGPLRVYTHARRSHTHVQDHVVQDCGNRQSCSPGLWKQTILWSRIVETNNPVVQDCGNEQSCSPGLWKQSCSPGLWKKTIL